MNEEFVMRPGDTFVAEECGCSFTVESGPNDENMVRQAPQCCCGHEMKKQGASMMGGMNSGMNTGMSGMGTTSGGGSDRHVGSPPRSMPD